MGQWGEALFCGGTILGKSTPMLNLNRSEIKNSFSKERYTRGRINLASTPTVYCPRCVLSPSTSVLSFQYVAKFRNTLSDVVARAGSKQKGSRGNLGGTSSVSRKTNSSFRNTHTISRFSVFICIACTRTYIHQENLDQVPKLRT